MKYRDNWDNQRLSIASFHFAGNILLMRLQMLAKPRSLIIKIDAIRRSEVKKQSAKHLEFTDILQKQSWNVVAEDIKIFQERRFNIEPHSRVSNRNWKL
ncbi:MAG: hypothetical protein IPH52_17135 [Leptospiraceae bacterium]|nr:hypothetical protein [Leptospiraceae bacterium]